jgi:lysophospholipase L1-like esterase
MKQVRPLLLVCTALITFVACPVGCGFFDSSKSTTPTATPPNFTATVVIGDSLSAGFQNGSLLDTQQPNGWASLVAKRIGFTLTLPLIAPPGAPAVLELTSLGPPPVITQSSGTSTGRDNSTIQPNDLAVPGHQLNDVINYAPPLVPTSNEDVITDLVLGFPIGNDKSQMNEAIALKPTALFVWAGSNDALLADDSGSPASMTTVTTFTQQITQLLTTLHTQTKAILVVANVPDVTAVPYLTPAATVIAEVAAETGLSQAQVSAALGIQAGDLVNSTGLSQVQGAVTAIKNGQTPTPLTDSGFLDATEIAAVQATILQYNAAIAQQVTAVGGVLVDIHTLIANLQQTGIAINGYNATTGFLGGLFSLDGVHNTNTGYALIANQFIDSINASLKTTFADVDVSAVAAVDPLFGPNIKATGSVVSIPRDAALSMDAVIGSKRSRANQDHFLIN